MGIWLKSLMASVWPNLCTHFAGVTSGPYGAHTPYIAVGKQKLFQLMGGREKNIARSMSRRIFLQGEEKDWVLKFKLLDPSFVSHHLKQIVGPFQLIFL